MFTELLEKFEDVFQPHSDEELDKRAGVYNVYFYPRGKGIRNIPHKKVKVKAFYSTALKKALKKLGLPEERTKYIKDTTHSYAHNEVLFKAEDRIKDDDGNLMDGEYKVIIAGYDNGR